MYVRSLVTLDDVSSCNLITLFSQQLYNAFVPTSDYRGQRIIISILLHFPWPSLQLYELTSKFSVPLLRFNLFPWNPHSLSTQLLGWPTCDHRQDFPLASYDIFQGCRNHNFISILFFMILLPTSQISNGCCHTIVFLWNMSPIYFPTLLQRETIKAARKMTLQNLTPPIPFPYPGLLSFSIPILCSRNS